MGSPAKLAPERPPRQLEQQAAGTHSDAEVWHIPLVTGLLIALNLSVFLYQAALPMTQQELFVLRWSAIPLEITENDLQPTTPFSAAVTLLTALFLHGNWLHLGSNMFYLWVFGQGVERRLGRARYLLVYLLSGVGGGLLQVAVNPTSLIPLVGASGAISGLMAAHLILFPRARAQLLVFIFWVAIQVGSLHSALTSWRQDTGGVALWAHAGGLALGTLLAFALWRRLPSSTRINGRLPASRE